MAILQISRITHRKGLQENLPQLAGAEFGWSLDERRLWIGNGKIEDGAPVIGNTEILTEFSDVLALSSTYTYKGERAGYIVNTGENTNDIVRSLQSKFDERVSVLDFGAKGDGVTDDTSAINRALFELFCREPNTEIRRALYFPAGKYIVKDTIKIPTFAKVFGDGISSSLIEYVSPDGGITVAPAVAVTSDSLHQIDVNIGNNGATPPTGIEISGLGIYSTEENDILVVDSTTDSSFTLVELKGPLGISDLTSAAHDTAAIRIVSSNSIASRNLTFDKCITNGTTYGLVANHEVRAVTFMQGKMSFHWRGANIAELIVGTGPTGINVTRTIFDDIATQGIYVGAVRLCSSAFNVFYNVGNKFGTSPASPDWTPVIEFANDGNVSIGDLFERNEADNITHPRIEINGTPCIALDSTHAIKLGRYVRETGLGAVIGNNDSGELFKVVSSIPSSFRVDYTIQRAGEIANGTIVAVNTGSAVRWTDDYTTSNSTGVTLSVVQNATTTTDTEVQYVVDNSGTDALVNFSIVRLDDGIAPAAGGAGPQGQGGGGGPQGQGGGGGGDSLPPE